MPFLCGSTLSDISPATEKGPGMEGDDFFTLPALSNLPSESKYAGLNFVLQPESFIHNIEFGIVSYMLPIEVYLSNENEIHIIDYQ